MFRPLAPVLLSYMQVPIGYTVYATISIIFACVTNTSLFQAGYSL